MQVGLQGTGNHGSLLKPCVASIIFGYCNTAACQAGWCRTCEAARAMQTCFFFAGGNRQARCRHAGLNAGPVVLQEPCWWWVRLTQ